jgi:CheY-like chemotaxis protein/HPt (histidine-containing phosphotransfer) domain-containing protein
LPVQRVDEPRATHKDVSLNIRAVPEESPHKLNILLAEDNRVNRVLAQKLLQKLGHAVTSVNNGAEAVKLWEQNQPSQFDLILMDVQMPEMDGLQAATRIREKELGTGARIPIIAVTAHAMKGDRERCLAAGMDGYIAKPINPAELAKAIQVAVPSGTKIAVVPVDPILKGPSDAELLARFDGDSELLKELAGIFLRECPRMLDEIRAALGDADSKALERAAHTLKGSVGNFAMPGSWETAHRLELLAKSGQLSGADEIFRALEQQIAQFNQVLARQTAEPAPQPL